MRHASEENALTQKCTQKIHANEDRFLMHEYIIACVVGVKWGRGRGNSSRRARRKISSRAGIPLSLFSFSLIFFARKKYTIPQYISKKKVTD